MSRRFKTRRQKKRSAAISATTVPTASFRGHVPSLQDAQAEEAQRGHLPLFEQIDLVPPQIVGADAGESSAGVSVKGPHDPEIARAGRRGVVPAHEFVVQALQ
jgi:hypothetical protein